MSVQNIGGYKGEYTSLCLFLTVRTIEKNQSSFIENKSHGGVGSTCSVVECGLWSGRWALDLEVNLKVSLLFFLFSFVVRLCFFKGNLSRVILLYVWLTERFRR